jgi:hypothetical protein
MTRVVGGIIAVVGLIGTSACRSPMVAGADYDPSVVIGQPATFAWSEPDGLPVGDPRLDNNPFFISRLHGTVARELASRGIRMAAAGRTPSLLIHHHASVHDHVEVFPTEQAPETTISPYGPGTRVYQYEEGNFIVDVVDPRTDKVVWRGWARVDLMDALDDPKALDELLSEAIMRMFQFFPIPVGTLPPLEEEPPVIEPVPDVGLPPPDVATRSEATRQSGAPQP